MTGASGVPAQRASSSAISASDVLPASTQLLRVFTLRSQSPASSRKRWR